MWKQQNYLDIYEYGRTKTYLNIYDCESKKNDLDIYEYGRTKTYLNIYECESSKIFLDTVYMNMEGPKLTKTFMIMEEAKLT